ncbi:MAG: hypothetical protein PHP57_06455 [Sideroxydans sp.]|nr:hypothetical protein [Sideroxydans sp.]
MFNIFEKAQMAVIAVLGLIGSIASAGLVQLVCGLGIVLALLLEVFVKTNLVRAGYYNR